MTLVERLRAEIDQIAAPIVKSLGLQLIEADAEHVRLTMPVTSHLVHGGGVLCGQAIMAAVDTAMVLALAAALDGFRPMTTVQLQTSFLRPVPGDAIEVHITARVLRKGKSLAFGEIEVATPDGRLAAHATTTYALL